MPSYEDFQRDYWAPDREQVLAQMQSEQQQPQQGQGLQPQWYQRPDQQQFPWQQGQEQQPQIKPWDRNAFRDQWMGMSSDPNEQNKFLSSWGINPQSLDASGRGRLPSGELLDLRFGAKAGINRPSWTAVGDPMGGNPAAFQGMQQQGGMGPSPQMMQGWGQMYGQQQGGQQGWGTPGQRMNPQQDPRMQQHRMFQNMQQNRQRMQQQNPQQMQQQRYRQQGGMQSQRQPQMQQPQYGQNQRYY